MTTQIQEDEQSTIASRSRYRYSAVNTDTRRRVFNWPVLLGSIVLMAIAVPLCYSWHQRQVGRLSKTFLARAATLESQEDFKGAANCLYRYLQIHPNASDVLVRLASNYEKAANSYSTRMSAIHWLYNSIGVVPDRVDLRCRLAELLYETRNYTAARREAEATLDLDPSNVDAERIRALALVHLQKDHSEFTVEMVVKHLRSVNSRLPADVLLAKTFAYFLRDQLGSAGEAEADRVIEALVSTNAQDPLAFLARHQYCDRYTIQDERNDLQTALDLSPTNTSVRLAAANSSSREANFSAAGRHFAVVVENSPNDARGYLGLGDVHYQNDRYSEAISIWQQGLDAVGPDHLHLNLRIAEALVQKQDYDQAEKVFAVIDRSIRQLATRGKEYLRPWAVTVVDMLRARQYRAQGRRQDALVLLHRVTATVSELPEDVYHGIAYQSWLMLGRCYNELRQWEPAAAAFDSAAEARDELAFPRLLAAESWAAAGQIDQALKRCQRALAAKDPPAEIWLLISQLKLDQQLRLPETQRDWQLVEDALQAAANVLPNSWELQLLKANYEIIRHGNAGVSNAMVLLAAAERSHSTQPKLWQRLVVHYQRMGMPTEAKRSLARYEALDENGIDSRILRADLAGQLGEFAEAARVLDALSDGNDNQRDVDYARLRLHKRIGDLDQIRSTLTRLHKKYPTDFQPLRELADAAMESGDIPEAEKWTKLLQAVEGPNGVFWRFQQARLLLTAATDSSDDRFLQAIALQSEIAGIRPYWPDGKILQGLLAEQEQRYDDAIEAFRQAIHLGAQRGSLYSHLIRLLHHQQRFVEADQYLEQLQTVMPLPLDLSEVAVDIASRRDQVQRMVSFARKSAEKRPDDFDSQIWLAQTLSISGNLNEAVIVFQRAAELNARDPQAWMGLALTHAKAGNVDGVSNAIDGIQNEVEVEPVRKLLLLGQAYEFVNDYETAAEHYQQAVQRDQKAIGPRLRLAFAVGMRDRTKAESILRETLKLAPKNAVVRRALAAVLSQNRADWAEVDSLLGSSNSKDVSDRRLRAVLYSRRGSQENTLKAIELFEELLSERSATPEDQLMLAQLHEKNGNTTSARSHYVALASSEAPSAWELARCVDFLLREGDTNAAEEWLDRLEKQAARGIGVVTLRCRWLDAVGQKEAAIELIEEFGESQLRDTTEPQRASQLVRSLGTLYESLGYVQQAHHWFERLANDFGDQEPLVRLLLGSQSGDNALKIIMESDVTAQSAALMANVLLLTDVDPALHAAAEETIQSAVEQFQDPNLLFAVGNLRLKQGRSRDAIELFHAATEAGPQHVLAWNNMAAILAELGEHERAIVCIENAIARAGFDVPTLMDTKAIVLLQQGKPRQAVTILRRVCRSPAANDPRYLLHLALACQQLGIQDEAANALKQADQMGLKDVFLTIWEREGVKQLKHSL